MVLIPIITDVHLRGSTPRSRLDPDYLFTQLSELEYILSFCDEGYVLCCGDLFDTPNVSHRVVKRLISLLNEHRVRLITTVGQHDVYGHNIHGYKDNTALGVMEASGTTIVLHAGTSYTIDDLEVWGFGFGELETKDFLNGKVFTDKKAIALVHATIGDNQMFDCERIQDQNIRSMPYSFFGDIHNGFNEHTFPDGSKAVSSGALARASKVDKDRPSKFILLDTQTFTYTIESIPFQTEDVFAEDTYTELIIGQSDAFRQALQETIESAKESPKELVSRIGRSLDYEPVVITMVINKIGAVEIQ
jgi:hypothetical protein